MDNYAGMKELYDVTIRLTSPAEFNGRKFNVNESLLVFKTAEIAQINEQKRNVQAKGGYHNIPLINWETDKEMNFGITNGVLSPVSFALLSNSKIELPTMKSVSYNEILNTIDRKRVV